MSEYEYFKANDLVSRIYEDNDLLYKCLETYKFMQKQTSFEVIDGIDTIYRMEEDTGIASVCSRTIIKQNIKSIIAHFREVDLQGQEEIDVIKLKNFSTFRNFYRSRIGMKGIDGGNVEFITYAFGAPIPGQNSIIICMKSTTKDFLKDHLPPEDWKYKRMICNYGFINVKYVDENTSLVSNCYNIDPDILIMPAFIINAIMRGFSARILCEAIARFGKSVHDPYEKRMEEKKDEYDKLWVMFQAANPKKK